MLRPLFSTFSRVALLLLVPLAGALPAANAATFTIDNLNDSGPGSLRAAIISANESTGPDVIDGMSCRGFIALDSHLPALRDTVTIKGAGANQLLICRANDNNFNLFVIPGDANVTLSGLTLTGGGGGGVEAGGAISNDGTLSLTNCILTSNSARRGGALFSKGSAIIEDCTFSNNAALGGAAINTNQGTLTISNTTFDNNSSQGDGGALVLVHTPTTLANSTFSNNRAGDNGISNSGIGGAILALGNGNPQQVGLSVTNCTFAANSAGQGGALWNRDQQAQLRNTTICDNIAVSGAGIWSETGTASRITLGACVLAGNSSSPSSIASDADWNGSTNGFVSNGYNFVGGGNGAALFSESTDRRGLTRQRLLLGPLDSNGGPTQTIAPLPTSPVIDAISPTALLVNRDQRGNSRPAGNGGDIGAVEADVAASVNLVVNTTSDSGDGICDATECTLREAIVTANNGSAPQGYTITFDPAVFSTPKSIGITQVISPDVRSSLVASGKMKIIGPGADLLSIQYGTSFQLEPRLFDVTENGNVQISGITFRYARPYYNFATIFNRGNLELTDCVIRDNVVEAPAGGGILNTGNLSLLRCTVTNNITRNFGASPKTYSGGGGIYSSGTLSVKDSIISNNTGEEGGGICNKGIATIENSTIANNTSAKSGGGIYSSSTLGITILNCTINSNTASSGGGGISAGGPFVLRNSTVAQNTARNSSVDGGIGLASSAAIIENCTIVANYQVGGVYVYGGTTNITNSVVASGTNFQSQPDVATATGASVVSGGYNFIGYGSSYSFSAPGDRYGGYVNLTTIVTLKPNLGPLASNGGPRQTIAPLPDSPLINMGDPNFDASTLPYDGRGIGFPRVVGGRLDIGAFETQSAPASASKRPAAKLGSAGAS
ncbi:CSLREA domain-containing protein [bacterium]|nr:MAG: CSLREA domain-containing protein [bacterium]